MLIQRWRLGGEATAVAQYLLSAMLCLFAQGWMCGGGRARGG